MTPERAGQGFHGNSRNRSTMVLIKRGAGGLILFFWDYYDTML